MLRKVRLIYSEYKLFRIYGNKIIKSLVKTIHLFFFGKTHLMPSYWI